MFYSPSTVASMVAASPLSSIYSDLHKDAIGCRPGDAQWVKVNAMSPVEVAVEEARLVEWLREDERIGELRTEVARFDFSRGMEYLQRREGMSCLDAFKMQIRRCCQRDYPNDNLPTWDECLDTVLHYGWEFLAMDCGLPQSDGVELKRMYDELRVEALSL